MDPRLSYQEAMELVEIHDGNTQDATLGSKRFMSTCPAWVPGTDLPWAKVGLDDRFTHKATYGGVVFSLSGQAALRTIQGKGDQLGLHSIQGCFALMGLADRPFVLDVMEISSGRNFATRTVHVRQPTVACGLTKEGRFSVENASRPLGRICFSAIVTFKAPAPTIADAQEKSPKEVYSQVIGSRAPWEWAPCPSVDMDWITAMFPDQGPGTFPVVDMRKVDMTGFNRGKPLTERREIILYRLLKPLPDDEPNHHALVHAFAADRNGLLMLGNNLDRPMETAATLSFSMYMHVNPRDTIMKHDPVGVAGWWMLEVSFPRASAGRGIVMSKVWSPGGVHVATGYQDGNARIMEGEELKGKL